MFDPLDLYDAVSSSVVISDNENSVATENGYLKGIEKDKKRETEDDELQFEDDVPITVLDLPPPKYADPDVLLAVLHLLQPTVQVNFKSCDNSNENADDIEDEISKIRTMDQTTRNQICLEKNLTAELRDNLVNWYQNRWPNPLLNSINKILIKVPALRNRASKDQLLTYYTAILSQYEGKKEDDEKNVFGNDKLLKEVSLRISECCGRTALPSMHRQFSFDNLSMSVNLFEPTLTADNLGWKTWGSSLILSRILVDDDSNFTMNPSDSDKPLRVLELGAGTGLVGIAWASKWKELNRNFTQNIEVYLTDLPDIVTNLQNNVVGNGLSSFVNADVLDWTNPADFIEKYSDQPFDVILVADPIYSPDHPQWVVNMITKFLATDGICHLEIPIRDKYKRERELLVKLLNEANLTVTKEEYNEGGEDWGGIVKYWYRKIVRR